MVVMVWLRMLRMIRMVCDGFAYVRMVGVVFGRYGLAENAENGWKGS